MKFCWVSLLLLKYQIQAPLISNKLKTKGIILCSTKKSISAKYALMRKRWNAKTAVALVTASLKESIHRNATGVVAQDRPSAAPANRSNSAAEGKAVVYDEFVRVCSALHIPSSTLFALAVSLTSFAPPVSISLKTWSAQLCII